MVYIATFYSHFGSIRYKKLCDSKGWPAKVMPVPRNLSSSCGTCVRFELAQPWCVDSPPEEVEQIVEVTEKGYHSIYRAENS